MYKHNSITNSKQLWYSPRTGQTYNHKAYPDLLYFSSQFEFSIYLKLKKEIKDYNLPFEVIHQHPVMVKPISDTFPELRYKLDFCIRDMYSEEEMMYIEAKGGWILGHNLYANEFLLKVQMLEMNNKDVFDKFAVVCDNDLYHDRRFQGKSWTLPCKGTNILERFKDYARI